MDLLVQALQDSSFRKMPQEANQLRNPVDYGYVCIEFLW